MNKKLVLSVLSTAVVASMTSAAMAAPKAGFYVGGDSNKYYSLTYFLQHTGTVLSDILKHTGETVYVSSDAKAGLFMDVIDTQTSEEMNKKMHTATKSDFSAKPYTIVGGTGSYDATTDPDLTGTVPGDLKVESVSVISKAGVTVSFPALTAAIENAKVVVKNNDVVVPVKEKLLDAGETTATFEFVTPLTADPAGTWTVDGVSFDANAQAAVAAVNAAAGAGGNQVKLLAALKSSYFKGVVDANIAAYATQLAAANFVTVADVQKVIDDVNNLATGDAAVKAVKDATNQVELLAALQKPNFKRVNADWIADYAVSYAAATTVADVQAIIDAKNDTALNTAIGLIGLDRAKLTAAKALVTSFKADDTDTQKAAKTAQLKSLDVVDAVIKVSEAQTKASLSAALTSLATLDSTNLDATKVNSVLMGEYLTAIKAAAATAKDTTSEIAGILYGATTGVNDVQFAAAVSAVATHFPTYTATDAANQASAKAELQRLGDVGQGNFDKATVKDALLSKYITDIKADLASGTPTIAGTDADKAAAIQTLVTDANEGVVTTALAAVDAEAGTPSDTTGVTLVGLLKASDLGLTNVVDANAAAYLADKAIIAAAITTPVATDLPVLKKAIDAINAVVAANNATTADQMRAALTAHSANLATQNTDYLNLTAQAKLEVADLVLKARGTTKFANSAAVTTALGATASAGQLKVHADILAAVNAEDHDSTISEMDSALSKVGYTAYDNLALDKRLAVAEKFIANCPVNATSGAAIALNYKSLADIKADIDKAIAAAN